MKVFILLQICRRHWLYPVLLAIVLTLTLLTDQSFLSVMLTVIHHHPIDGWTSIQTKLKVDKTTLYQYREITVYSVQQAMTWHLLTAESYHTACLQATISTVCTSLYLPVFVDNIFSPHVHSLRYYNHALAAFAFLQIDRVHTSSLSLYLMFNTFHTFFNLLNDCWLRPPLLESCIKWSCWSNVAVVYNCCIDYLTVHIFDYWLVMKQLCTRPNRYFCKF